MRPAREKKPKVNKDLGVGAQPKASEEQHRRLENEQEEHKKDL